MQAGLFWLQRESNQASAPGWANEREMRTLMRAVSVHVGDELFVDDYDDSPDPYAELREGFRRRSVMRDEGDEGHELDPPVGGFMPNLVAMLDDLAPEPAVRALVEQLAAAHAVDPDRQSDYISLRPRRGSDRGVPRLRLGRPAARAGSVKGRRAG